MKIETVFLDAGGVLVWPNWTRVAEALRRHGVDVDAQALAAADAVARFSLDEAHAIGKSTDQRRSNSFFDLVLMEAGLELSEKTAAALAEIREYHREHNLWEILPDFVMPALRTLRSDGHKLVVVSNANGTLHQLFDRLGLAPMFDVMLDSEVERLEKPDRRFFELALSRSKSAPATTVHVGDFYNIDVTGARGAGLQAILVDELDLHNDADCTRIRSIAELPRLLRG
jgi:HAD superfamily hydrolase (TIGR01549 family)